MPLRDRTARDRFARQASFGGFIGGARPVMHHPAARRTTMAARPLPPRWSVLYHHGGPSSTTTAVRLVPPRRAVLYHHGVPYSTTAARRTSVQDAAALRNRRRSTLRRQVARDLIAEEEVCQLGFKHSLLPQ